MTFRLSLNWRGREAAHRAEEASRRGLELAANHVLGIAQQRVPLEEGTLQDSGRAVVDTASLTAGVTFDTVYARRQHEELTWRHAPGRTAKYVEGPLTEEAARCRGIIGAAIRWAHR